MFAHELSCEEQIELPGRAERECRFGGGGWLAGVSDGRRIAIRAKGVMNMKTRYSLGSGVSVEGQGRGIRFSCFAPRR